MLCSLYRGSGYGDVAAFLKGEKNFRLTDDWLLV
jgi:hypothetical protein